MPRDRDDESTRRRVVPEAAGRSLWLSAVWTGVGAAVVCATIAIVVVAACWLPVSGTTGRTNSAIRAGLLTFLASVHGGVTVDGVHAQWLPLGMLLAVALVAWRAGAGLADAAGSLGEHDPTRLAVAGAAQAASFTATCLVAVPFATLGTSAAPLGRVGLGALVLFSVSGGIAFVRSTSLSDWCADRTPAAVGPALRATAAALAVYLGAAAVLVAGSLVVHHHEVEILSRQVGGGWGGVPILLLGLLAAPNAVIAGAGYLAGPGLTVGAGTHVTLFGTAHGTLPAFPLLGALPPGDGAGPLVWVLAAGTACVAGAAVTRVCLHAPTWAERFGRAGLAAAFACFAMAVLAWQGGGAVADGRLHTVGSSPWQAGLAVGTAVAILGAAGLGVAVAARQLRDRPSTPAYAAPDESDAWRRLRLIARAADARGAHDAAEPDDLAG